MFVVNEWEEKDLEDEERDNFDKESNFETG